ncbi:hypothetical protein ACLB2K_060463 [Fragaria x ananassa]
MDWIRLIMVCVTTVSFAIVLNGKPGRTFYPTRGLRQGDPISPYLFLLVSEVLSLRLTKCVGDGSLIGIRLSRGGPIIAHLFFADDALFFILATLGNASRLSLIFKDYCPASGQAISQDKSSIFFSTNSPEQMVFLLCGADQKRRHLGVETCGEPYLFMGTEVLESRYFPDCDFFSAVKGYRASWSWSSLLEARDIILAGCCWQVVNGSSVRVWQDKWLPNPSPRLLASSTGPRPTAPVLVRQLID